MQLVGTGQAVKEKDFFCKSEFSTFEATVRQNFDPRNEANPQVCSWTQFRRRVCAVRLNCRTGRSYLLHGPTGRRRLKTGLWQYQDYDHDKGDTSPKSHWVWEVSMRNSYIGISVVWVIAFRPKDWAKTSPPCQVLVGTCVMRPEEEEGAASAPLPNSSGPSIHPKTDLPVDTITDSTKTRFYKVTYYTSLIASTQRQYFMGLSIVTFCLFLQFSMNEVYPEFVLVYRKKTGGKDTRYWSTESTEILTNLFNFYTCRFRMT